MSLKAAVTLTLLSSASALTSLRLRRELPATNGQLDITDTCDKYQTKEDCCAEVNCQFAAPDKCTKRNAPAENGECPGDRAPPTNSRWRRLPPRAAASRDPRATRARGECS